MSAPQTIPRRQSLEVWGDLACFTNPVLKVERFSYPIITPSAARAIFDAIYWKPRFRWQIVEIETLTEPRYIGLLRNEVQRKLPEPDTILRWAQHKAEPAPMIAGAGSDVATPRQTMALKEVRYRLHAQARPWDDDPDTLRSIEAQFRRRAGAGQAIYQPYLGCREFPAYFRLLTPEEGASPAPDRAAYDRDLGWMLYDVFDLSRRTRDNGPAYISAFRAEVKEGVLAVPPFDSPLVKKPGPGQEVLLDA